MMIVGKGNIVNEIWLYFKRNILIVLCMFKLSLCQNPVNAVSLIYVRHQRTLNGVDAIEAVSKNVQINIISHHFHEEANYFLGSCYQASHWRRA